ncbi:hypothetical protein HYFRA_00004120 [Hymenoscyphus fraxineus]|uniref:Phospholipase D1 n=1 Tax=Hymenoscyphus fraxineus TaxID=746836 RepID=A0A9N9KQK8_9HELO|nr:hypothetical protein HYFRA_00004120 [Hymenoscyphus fraxineus]
MAHQYDEDISPMTSNPRFELPLHTSHPNGSATAPLRQSGLRKVADPDGGQRKIEASHPLSTIPNGSSSSRPPSEVQDYLNGGIPHENVRPKSSSEFKQSALKAPQLPSNDGGTLTPPARRSVQFARSDYGSEGLGIHNRTGSWVGAMEDGSETPGRDKRGQSLISKLKALATTGGLQTHSRNQSVDDTTPAGTTPQSAGFAERTPNRLPHTLHEEGEGSDADAEETADEGDTNDAARGKRKRRIRRPYQSQSVSQTAQTAPNTPRTRAMGPAESPSALSRPFPLFGRRATDGSLEQRGHLSEGEGRDRLGGGPSAWRRGSSWMRSSQSGSHIADMDGTPSGRRPSNFRRALSGMGGQSDGDTPAPRRPFLRAERATTFGAQRWRIIKHSIKLLGQKKEEHRVDYLKSAELMAELRAGAPAALMLASMIQRDEHGNKRIPVLLEQLKIRLTESKPSIDDSHENDRHLVFKIELEYGSGLNRMKWNIHRSLRDFAELHMKYKIQSRSDKYILQKGDLGARPKQPRFPKSAFPYFRGARGYGEFGESDSDEADRIPGDETAAEATAAEGTAAEASNSEQERTTKKKKRRASLGGGLRRKSSMLGGGDGAAGSVIAGGQQSAQARLYNERQRRKLEQYLQEMIRWLIFRADSNRLCKFLELSAMGVRLAAEGSYHGKEGFLTIMNVKGMDFKHMLMTRSFRNPPKWFLVRHSYVVCVESPENMQIHDVFLVDSKFELQKKRRKIKEGGGKDPMDEPEMSAKHSQHHTLKLQNSERKIRLGAKYEKHIRQFEESLEFMLDNTPWAKENRFGSFAPVRTGVAAQWLVDGRDYMWNVSRAINMAKDVIYIHDWWLSPQLYMRRPAAISQKWRLDRLLQRKAREGIKVFIIIYRNVEAAIPIDSQFTKISMLDLHPNIFVQRSPNQYKKNQFFFAHHEKLCIVDHTIAFVGGIDLCFGRWDTPQHSVVDDKPTGFEQSHLPKDADNCQSWPGKDYSNPRVQDFYQLDEPYAEMYDRSKVPRMPWHDISMQVVGQPARDLTRHFIQRWNYVLRGRTPTRPTPFLLPPPDYETPDLEALGLNGTCEVQILRSASDWSLGLTETEHSIMTAYCKMIEESEHFVYMENQFFITSCETMNVKIVNKIGDAIVERAIRAAQNNERWKCVILIPLMPGFQNTVDEPEGTSVRLIMQCQFRSICRGEGSIFGRLRSVGIDPEDYVQFYSLRTYGRIGPKKTLVTEQLYIHAKVIIVDDRIALIGSANINERSMLGNRDSETAAVVRDTDMISSYMAGKPYLVGRFAHTLRMRLMREHLGLDVDEIMEEERREELDREEEVDSYESRMNDIYDSDDSDLGPAEPRMPRRRDRDSHILAPDRIRSFKHSHSLDDDDSHSHHSHNPRMTNGKQPHINEALSGLDGNRDGYSITAESSQNRQGRDTVLVDGYREVLVTDISSDGKGTLEHPKMQNLRSSPPRAPSSAGGKGTDDLPPMPGLPRRTTEQLGLPQLSQLPALPSSDDTDIGGPPIHIDAFGNAGPRPFNPLTADIKQAPVDKDCMRDPLNDDFFENTWRLMAENNTKIYRRVFRCNPDTEVQSWHDYTEYVAYAERFAQAQSGSKSTEREEQEAPGKSGPPGSSIPLASASGIAAGLNNLSEKVKPNGDESHPPGSAADWAADSQKKQMERSGTVSSRGLNLDGQPDGFSEKEGARRTSIDASDPNVGNESFPPFETTLSPPAENEKQGSTRKTTFSSAPPPERPSSNLGSQSQVNQGSVKKRRRGTTKSTRRGFSASDGLLSMPDVEELLSLIQGHLVLFPYDWLVKEELNSNWLYQVDQVAPLQIYD